jgi:hypothetical protein
MWQRSDGALLSLRSKLFVQLELPSAHEYETKLKAEETEGPRIRSAVLTQSSGKSFLNVANLD